MIYQEARPFTFDQVVGQEHVKDVLVAALNRGRIGHAYLFSGPRGVGKTTTARLLAMAVNCEAADIRQRPCGVCEACRLIRAGNHPDVIELDAASNNSVEDIRDLREKVRLSSMRGGKRVWVLDEAHMLSRAASNALLKTLEEPPDNLVFILATTEPEKLPPTILSRCQHFRFRRLSEAEILSKLVRLCHERDTEADDEALQLVARAADGAMRDAESLLERLLTTGERISRKAVESALGLPPSERMQRLAEHLSKRELHPLLQESSSLYHDGFAPSSLAEQLIKTLRDALFTQVSGSAGFTLPLAQDELLRLIHALDDDLERFTRRDDLFALEVSLIKGINTLAGNSPAAVATSAAATDPTPATRPLPDFDPHTRAVATTRPASAPPAKATASAKTASISWHAVKKAASAQLKAFLNPAQDKIEGQTIELLFDERHSFHFNQLKARVDELMTLIETVYGEPFELLIAGPGESLRKKA
jgi:DNA polymerase-3 subunit gamma/tau